MRPAACLLALALASSSHHRATASPSFSGSYNPVHGINIATVTSTSDGQDLHNSSSSAEFEDPIDLVLVANTSIPSNWADSVVGYTSAAESRVLYQAASWTLLDEGTQSGKYSSYWARFQSVNPTVKTSAYLSVCAMVAEWNSSWSDTKSALFAVDLEERMAAKCGENDTIAVAFSSAVNDTAASYLEGEVAVNGVVAALKMHDVESSVTLEDSHRMFVRLANGLCPRDESANELKSLAEAGIPVISLFRGLVCKASGGFGPSQTPGEGNDSKNDSDWKDDLRFIIPIGVFLFLLGCAGLIYLYRRQKKDSEEETPKEVEKDEASSLPYVLTMHSVA